MARCCSVLRSHPEMKIGGTYYGKSNMIRSVKWGKGERMFRIASRDARISRYNAFEPGNV